MRKASRKPLSVTRVTPSREAEVRVGRSMGIGAALAFALLAAGAAVALSKAPSAQALESATALIRFERFEGTLGSGLDAEQNLADRSRVARAAGRELRLDPVSVLGSVRLAADPATGIVAVTATRPTPGEARALATAFTRELVSTRRRRLLVRAGEARRYLVFLLARRGEESVSETRRRELTAERVRLTRFMADVRANDNPLIVQAAQSRAAPTSRAALLSGLVAAIGGLLVALGVARVARRRGAATPDSRSSARSSWAGEPPGGDPGSRDAVADRSP